ncbi:MAG: hypothetical protein J6I64_01985, partial [Lachnospiraceae bacterium]|nr:hypothetical protein [Lachnospiraceae bacterium]
MEAIINTTMINWAVSGTVILLVVLVLRRLFGERISRRMRYALWLVVLVRLLVPVSFGSSGWSIQNWLPVEMVQTEDQGDLAGGFLGNDAVKDNIGGNAGVLPDTMISGDGQNIWQEQLANGQAMNQQPVNDQAVAGQSMGSQSIYVQPGDVQQNTASEPREGLGTTENGSVIGWILPMLLQIWRIGAVLGIGWVLVANGRFFLHLKRTRCQVGEYQEMAVYTAAELVSPCLFGLWHPAIYLTGPVAAQDDVKFYAIFHEGCHRAHG